MFKGMIDRVKNKRTGSSRDLRRACRSAGPLMAVLLTVFLLAGCGGGSRTETAAESAAEDLTDAVETADTGASALEEEPVRVTTETALVGICLAKTENGDNDRLLRELREALVLRGFVRENILEKEMTGSRTRQDEEIEECLSEGCSLLVVSAVSDERIPSMADRIAEGGAQVLFVNCTPDVSEIERWEMQDLPAVWLGTTYAQELACQMTILYDYSGTDRGLDFNEDGHVGALIVGGGDQARSALQEAVHDLGTELQILGETDSEDPEEISAYTQEILNEHRKACELVLCSTEAAMHAAADGVQLRHRLVGRDILVIGAGTHEDTCTSIVNKLISGSTFVDFYEQANLAAVAAKDMIEGNQAEKTISNVIFKVTEENAQEILDQLWNTRSETVQEEDGSADSGEEESEAAASADSGEEESEAAASVNSGEEESETAVSVEAEPVEENPGE